MNPVTIEFNADDLRTLVRLVAAEVLAELEEERAKLGHKLAVREAEAGELLSVPGHVVRDLRLAGRLSGTPVGRRIRYEVDELRRYLRENRVNGRP